MRCINLIVFLNPGWDDSWGGALELWDRDMTQCVVSVAPRFNRAVLFDTDKTSFHGHPEPLVCPPGRTRRSMALYYYARAARGGGAVDHRTNWQVRPGSGDSPRGLSPWRRLARRIARMLTLSAR